MIFFKSIVMALLILLMLTACKESNNQQITSIETTQEEIRTDSITKIVQNFAPKDKSKNYKEAFENFFESPSWEEYDNIVKFKGYCIYADNRVLATIKFIVYNDDVVLGDLKFDDKKMDILVRNALISNIFEE